MNGLKRRSDLLQEGRGNARTAMRRVVSVVLGTLALLGAAPLSANAATTDYGAWNNCLPSMSYYDDQSMTWVQTGPLTTTNLPTSVPVLNRTAGWDSQDLTLTLYLYKHMKGQDGVWRWYYTGVKSPRFNGYVNEWNQATNGGWFYAGNGASSWDLIYQNGRGYYAVWMDLQWKVSGSTVRSYWSQIDLTSDGSTSSNRGWCHW